MRKENITCEEKKDLRPAVVEVTRINAQGEILSETTYYAKKQDNQNGSGFVLSYTEKMSEFIIKYSSGSTVRLFLYLAHHQQYGTDGVYGYRCSHKFLRQVLNLDKKTVYNAFATLKKDFLVHELRVDGVSEFMVNPNYVTMGKDKKDRLRVWNARWADSFKNEKPKVVPMSAPVEQVAPKVIPIDDALAVIVKECDRVADLYPRVEDLVFERSLSTSEAFDLLAKARHMFVERILKPNQGKSSFR